MGNRVEGRVAIVTGAGRGIGREVARWLARDGAKVVVNDLGGAVDGSGDSATPADQTVSEITAEGGEAVASYDSVADFDSAGRIVQKAIDQFGRVDILCHPAGILRDRMVFNMTEAEWDAVLQVHLYGAFNMVRNVSPHMINQRYGRISHQVPDLEPQDRQITLQLKRGWSVLLEQYPRNFNSTELWLTLYIQVAPLG